MGEKTEESSGIGSAAKRPLRHPAAQRARTVHTALGALAGAVFLWSGTFIAMKVALTAFHPIFLMFIRMTGSVLLLTPFLRRLTTNLPYAKGDWRIFAVLVISEPCLYFVFESYALKYTSASQASIVTSLMPLLVGVSAFCLLRERLSATVWAGLVLALGGVVWLTLEGEDSASAPNALLGNTLEFFAMVMACNYTLCVRKLLRYPPFYICAAQAFAGMLFFGILFALMGFPLPETLPDIQPVLALAYLSIVTILAYGMYNHGVASLSAGQAAVWINLIPALTLFMGITLLNERLNTMQSLAVLPILAGVALSLCGKFRS